MDRSFQWQHQHKSYTASRFRRRKSSKHKYCPWHCSKFDLYTAGNSIPINVPTLRNVYSKVEQESNERKHSNKEKENRRNQNKDEYCTRIFKKKGSINILLAFYYLLNYADF